MMLTLYCLTYVDLWMKLHAGSQAARAKRNAQMMDRLKTMKSETNNQVSAILGKMFGMSGKDPKSMMSEDKMNEYLMTAFRVKSISLGPHSSKWQEENHFSSKCKK